MDGLVGMLDGVGAVTRCNNHRPFTLETSLVVTRSDISWHIRASALLCADARKFLMKILPSMNTLKTVWGWSNENSFPGIPRSPLA